MDEADEIKISIILKWIHGSDSHEDILTGKGKMKNITFLLGRMKYNGYLRLFEIDMSSVKNHMTGTSWTLFEDFKSKHKEDAWKCPQCSSFFVANLPKWKCDRCLLWHHEACTKARNIRQDGKSSGDYSLCESCFFGL